MPTQVGKKAKAHWKRNIPKSQGCDQSSGCGTGEDLNLKKYYISGVFSNTIMLLILKRQRKTVQELWRYKTHYSF